MLGAEQMLCQLSSRLVVVYIIDFSYNGRMEARQAGCARRKAMCTDMTDRCQVYIQCMTYKQQLRLLALQSSELQMQVMQVI